MQNLHRPIPLFSCTTIASKRPHPHLGPSPNVLRTKSVDGWHLHQCTSKSWSSLGYTIRRIRIDSWCRHHALSSTSFHKPWDLCTTTLFKTWSKYKAWPPKQHGVKMDSLFQIKPPNITTLKWVVNSSQWNLKNGVSSWSISHKCNSKLSSHKLSITIAFQYPIPLTM